jgi:hypothetical protein
LDKDKNQKTDIDLPKVTKHFNIKQYNADVYKITEFKTPFFMPGREDYRSSENRNINEEKLDNNISRAKSMIFEYAACNEFDYFVTFTLSKDKHDRYDLTGFIKKLGQDIRDLRKRKGIDIKYLLIPEPHKDGAWHMHGLIKGIPLEQLELFTLEDKLPNRLLDMIKKGRKIYNWPLYSEKYGFCTLEKVRSQIAISKYITKYISKALRVELSREKEKKLYYNTKGLSTALEVYRGLYNPKIDIVPDYENEYVKTKMLTEFEYKLLISELNYITDTV